MERLLELTEQLKKELDEQEEIKKIKELNQKIQKEKQLQEQLLAYQKEKDPSIKEQIYKNKTYQEYKEAETNINLLIMEINQELKKIKNKGKCNL